MASSPGAGSARPAPGLQAPVLRRNNPARTGSITAHRPATSARAKKAPAAPSGTHFHPQQPAASSSAFLHPCTLHRRQGLIGPGCSRRDAFAAVLLVVSARALGYQADEGIAGA